MKFPSNHSLRSITRNEQLYTMSKLSTTVCFITNYYIELNWLQPPGLERRSEKLISQFSTESLTLKYIALFLSKNYLTSKTMSITDIKSLKSSQIDLYRTVYLKGIIWSHLYLFLLWQALKPNFSYSCKINRDKHFKQLMVGWFWCYLFLNYQYVCCWYSNIA